MNSRTPFAFAAVAVALASATAALVLRTGQPAAAQSERPTAQPVAAQPVVAQPVQPSGTTLRFVAHDEPGNEAFDDLGAKSPNGPDIGDLLAFTQTLTRDGRVVGQIHVAAVGVDHKRQLSHADGTLVLAGGDIEVAGIVSPTPTFTLAVVGGTGAYTGETGTLVFDESGSQQTLTLHLDH